MGSRDASKLVCECQRHYLVVDQSGKREEVEKVGEGLPHVRVAILAKALVVEPIPARTLVHAAKVVVCLGAVGSAEGHVHLGDLSALMVASEDGDPVLEPDFQRYQEGNRFN